jgi:signal transduction histidine kinase
MLSHLDSNHLCQITAAQIQEILVLNGTIIQQYQTHLDRWLTISQLPDTADLILKLDPSKSREIDRRIHQQEIVEFTAMTTVMNISICNRYLFVPLIDRGTLWGRICLLGNQQTVCSAQDLAWVQALGQQLVTAINAMNGVVTPHPRYNVSSAPLDTVANLIEQVANLEIECQRKDEFISHVSHDLRAPLMNITMAARMLRISLEKDPVISSLLIEHRAQKYLQVLEAECQRQIELINHVLDLQKLEITAETNNLELIEIPDWIENITAPFLERTAGRHQHFHLEIAEDLPILTTDRNHLTKIVTELLNNACKYTNPDGRITLEISRSSNRERVCINISNEAEISSDHLPRIFDQFYRIPGADRAGQGGTGLGLSLVQKLVAHLQGEMNVISDRGWTKFSIELPVSWVGS